MKITNGLITNDDNLHKRKPIGSSLWIHEAYCLTLRGPIYSLDSLPKVCLK